MLCEEIIFKKSFINQLFENKEREKNSVCKKLVVEKENVSCKFSRIDFLFKYVPSNKVTH